MIQSMRDNPRGSVEVDWKYEVKGDHFGNWQMIRGGMIRSPGHRYRFRLSGWAKSSQSLFVLMAGELDGMGERGGVPTIRWGH